MVRLMPLAIAVVVGLGSAGAFTPPTAVSAEPTVRVVYHGARTKPVVALTFDDGYSVSNCREILEILQRRKVAATFFPYARAVNASPGFWRHVADAGYPIANHSTTHPKMTELSLAEATSEIVRAREIVEQVTGHRMIRVFRPPYGLWDKTVVEAARLAGFSTVLLWDVDDTDWSSSLSRSGMLRRALRGRDGSVILMHCGPNATPRILERVIDGYIKRGFGFVTVPQLLSGQVPATAFPPLPPKPPPAPEWVDPDRRPFSLMSLSAYHRFGAWAV